MKTDIPIKVLLSSKMKSVLFNSGWLLLDKCARLFLGIFVGAWVAKFLGPGEYGKLAFTISVMAFFQVVCYLGLDAITVRDISKKTKESYAIIGTVLGLRLIVGGGIFVLMMLYVFNHEMDIERKLIFAFVSISLIFQSFDTFDLWFQSQSRSKYAVKSKLVSYFISNLSKIAFIYADCSVVFFAFSFALEYFISSMALCYSYTKFKVTGKLKFSPYMAINLLKESWPFIVSGMSIVIYMRIDQLMIADFLGEIDLGIYSALLPLSASWSFVPMILSISLAPLITKTKLDSEDEYRRYLFYIYKAFFFLGVIVSISIFIFGSFFVEILYGKEYIPGVVALKLHSISNIFLFMGVAQSMWIVNERRSKLSLLKTFTGAIVCIVSNAILIPAFGIKGAAISAILAQATSAVLSNILFAPEAFRMQFFSIVRMRYVRS